MQGRHQLSHRDVLGLRIRVCDVHQRSLIEYNADKKDVLLTQSLVLATVQP